LSETEELARALLEKALEDLEATEVLYYYSKKDLKELAIYHLEQASEKIIKAFFIGFIIDGLSYILHAYDIAERAGSISINSLSRYEELHQLIKNTVDGFKDPKRYGHNLKLLDELLKQVHKEFCSGDFGGYLELVFIKGFIPALHAQKQKVVEELVSKGLSIEQSEDLFNFIIGSLTSFFKQYIAFIKSPDFESKVCGDRFGRLDVVKKASEKIKKSLEPCIHTSVEVSKSIDKIVKSILEKTLEGSPEAVQAFEKAEISLRDITSQIGLPTLGKSDLKTFIVNLLRGIVLVTSILPLHFCLLKYHEVSRYSKGGIPAEEHQAVPEAIELLKEVYGVVEHLI